MEQQRWLRGTPRQNSCHHSSSSAIMDIAEIRASLAIKVEWRLAFMSSQVKSKSRPTRCAGGEASLWPSSRSITTLASTLMQIGATLFGLALLALLPWNCDATQRKVHTVATVQSQMLRRRLGNGKVIAPDIPDDILDTGISLTRSTSEDGSSALQGTTDEYENGNRDEGEGESSGWGESVPEGRLEGEEEEESGDVIEDKDGVDNGDDDAENGESDDEDENEDEDEDEDEGQDESEDSGEGEVAGDAEILMETGAASNTATAKGASTRTSKKASGLSKGWVTTSTDDILVIEVDVPGMETLAPVVLADPVQSVEMTPTMGATDLPTSAAAIAPTTELGIASTSTAPASAASATKTAPAAPMVSATLAPASTASPATPSGLV